MQILNAAHIGRVARRLLQADAQGTVLALVSNAVYLETASAELFWLSEAGVPCHLRNVEVEHIPGSIRTGANFHMRMDTLRLGDDVRIETGGAASWRIPTPATGNLLDLPGLPGRWLDFNQAYVPLHPQGFGVFLDLIRATAFPAVFHHNGLLLDAVGWAALPALEQVLGCCLNHDMTGALDHGQDLIGLGGGLTPSGDDYLGGLIFVIHHLGGLYDIPGLIPPSMLDPWLEAVRSRTHFISHVLLSDHAHGSGAETLHTFMNSFLSREPIEETVGHALQLSELGHSTGQDLIAGVMTGLLLGFPARLSARKLRVDETAPMKESTR